MKEEPGKGTAQRPGTRRTKPSRGRWLSWSPRPAASRRPHPWRGASGPRLGGATRLLLPGPGAGGGRGARPPPRFPGAGRRSGAPQVAAHPGGARSCGLETGPGLAQAAADAENFPPTCKAKETASESPGPARAGAAALPALLTFPAAAAIVTANLPGAAAAAAAGRRVMAGEGGAAGGGRSRSHRA